jgi:phenylpropionate dioxygenase-like ring-hydroxylating dioxygenase large terminal subunit
MATRPATRTDGAAAPAAAGAPDVTAPDSRTAEGRAADGRAAEGKGRGAGRLDWSTWPKYQAADSGLKGYWYPVLWADQVTSTPQQVRLCGENIVVLRDGGTVRALHDRCPHRGVPLSEGKQFFPGTITCPYHGWTFDAGNGLLKAVITDGPESPICGKVSVRTYPTAERLGLLWIFVGDQEPHPIDEQLPEELVGTAFTVGGRIDVRGGNWRFAAENGYDEGHAKFLHRTSLWRLFKSMPTWNITHIERRGRWIYRVQDAQYWEADFPGVGHWTNNRWWKKKPPKADGPSNIGNTGARPDEVHPVIAAQKFPGFASLSLPGVLRIAYPAFIHYEFYVPVDADAHRYVGVMVDFRTGAGALRFAAKYLGAVRWLFHGQFSGQDKWMVDLTDAPPERLYRPDVSLTSWRALVEACTNDDGTSRWPQTVAATPARGVKGTDEGVPLRGRTEHGAAAAGGTGSVTTASTGEAQ